MNDVALDDFYQDQVDAYIDSIDVPEGAREPFLVDCDGKADWCLRKILPHQKRIDAIQRQAKERIRIVKAWEADETLRHSSEITRFEAFLYPYVTEQLKGSKNKTYPLISGSVSMRASSPEFTIGGEKVSADNLVLLEHIKQFHPELLKIEESVAWGEFKQSLISTASGKVVTSDGEILDFMTASTQPDKISVKEVKR